MKFFTERKARGFDKPMSTDFDYWFGWFFSKGFWEGILVTLAILLVIWGWDKVVDAIVTAHCGRDSQYEGNIKSLNNQDDYIPTLEELAE